MIYRKKLGLSLFSAGLLILNTGFGYAAPALSLQDSIDLALQNSQAIKMAAADNAKAQWGINETKSSFLPSASLSTSGTRSSSLAGDAASSFNSALRLNWQLYSGGRNNGLMDQAKLNADSADLALDKTKQQTVLDATTAYFSVLQAKNMEKVNQETVDSLTAHLNNVQAQYGVGVVAKSDVLRSEVELASAKQNLTKAQNAYDVAVATLNNIIGEPLDTANEYSDDFNHDSYDVSLEDSIKAALTNRPEIAQAQNNIEIAEAGVRVAKSGDLPTVNLSGTTGVNGNSFPGNNDNWSVGLTASWNIFDAGLTSAKVKEARTSTDKALAAQKQTSDAIELEVRQAYLGIAEAQQRIQTAQVAIDKASEDMNIAQTKYQAGVGTNLDVIDAQLALTQAKTNYTQAFYDYSVGKAKLNKAVGEPQN
ncbi:MAG: TolC family protein [Pelosinus sp.]|nr:TolC family protein [Pelosinus sp.]